MTVHGVTKGSGLTTCCSRTPFELPRSDRLAAQEMLVTCKSKNAAQAGRWIDSLERELEWASAQQPAERMTRALRDLAIALHLLSDGQNCERWIAGASALIVVERRRLSQGLRGNGTHPLSDPLHPSLLYVILCVVDAMSEGSDSYKANRLRAAESHLRAMWRTGRYA